MMRIFSTFAGAKPECRFSIILAVTSCCLISSSRSFPQRGVSLIRDHAFLKPPHLQHLLSHNFLQIAGFTAEVLQLIGVGSTRSITC